MAYSWRRPFPKAIKRQEISRIILSGLAIAARYSGCVVVTTDENGRAAPHHIAPPAS